jgi:cyclopropane fatty-acyl-phospholipid synthase-like methyltransferase/glycosyltransferase involved in cell wall biosynthesis
VSCDRARVLLCAPEIPEPQRQSGSRRLFHNIELLREAGAHVTVVAEHVGGQLGGQQDRLRLQQLGVPVFTYSELPDLLEPGAFNLSIVAFWQFAEKCVRVMRERAPEVPIVVDTIDLDFVRRAREGLGSPSNGGVRTLDSTYGDRMQRELNVYASADRVLTVSDKERATVSDLTNDRALAVCVPDYEEYPMSSVPLDQRRGLLFVGNFRHPPNQEALKFLCREIVPKLDESTLAAHPALIVGNALDGDLLDLCRETAGLEPIGFVPSLVPYFAQSRAFVAPLLTGAGTKRKLIQALMVGVPVVATSVATEGLEIVDGEGALIADGPGDMAAEISRLLTDDASWEQIAGGGREAMVREHGRDAVRERLIGTIEQLLEPTAKGGEANVMKRDWDERAKSNAMHYIVSGESEWDEKEFFESGKANVEQTVTEDLDLICQGREASQMRMLEIGCGIGRMTRHLAGVFGEVHAVDVSGAMIAKAREKLADLPNVHLLETSGSDLAPFDDGFFDFAYSFIVFQHIPDKDVIVSYFREVHRTLKPGCLFKFQVQGQEMKKTDTWIGAGFSAEEISSLAAEIGFTPIRSSGEGTQYFWNWWLRE